MPAAAVTDGGAVTVSSGSRSAIRNAAPGAPQAILVCVSASDSTAYDCASLPVPAVVGTPSIGSIGWLTLPYPL